MALGLRLGDPLVMDGGQLIAMEVEATWDVAMNIEGGAVEHVIDRQVMPRLHAGFSVGTAVGAGAGALAALVGLPVSVHLGAVVAAVLGGDAVGTRGCLPHTPAAVAPGPRT